MKNYTWIFRELFFEEVKKLDAMVNCHGHFDRAYTIDPDIWAKYSFDGRKMGT